MTTPKESSRNNVINRGGSRQDGVVPFAVERVRLDGEGGHLFIRYRASSRIALGNELALHRQPRFGGGGGNQLEDHRVANARLATPVLADPGEETMLDLVPFAGSRRQVADHDGETRL